MGRQKKLCNDTDIPQDQIERIARCLLPDILSFFESEEGQKNLQRGSSSRTCGIPKTPQTPKTGQEKETSPVFMYCVMLI